MQNKKLLLTLSFLILVINTFFAQNTKRVFFIGNSYTYFNSLPNLLNNIANNHGDTIIHSSSTPGGAQLSQHVINSSTINGIKQGNWDFIVLQEQSQKPSFPDAQVATDVYPYARQLNDTIEKYNPCGETAFFMTWGRKNGDQQNCQFFTPLCTFDGMNERLRNAYLQMANDNNAICSPVGAVWKVMRDSFPNIDLYNPDESHPSYEGSYLAACTFYATLFRKPTVGTTYYGSLIDSTAQKIHRIVDLVVLDSFSNWNIGNYDVASNFTTTINLDTAILSNQSNNAVNYSWDYGDGSIIDTTANPNHVYSSAGNYNITLIATDSCGKTDTSSQVITINTITDMAILNDKNLNIRCYPNPTKGFLNIESLDNILSVKIINTLGQEVFYQKNINQKKKNIYLSSEKKGIYYIYINTKDYKCFVNKLVLQ